MGIFKFGIKMLKTDVKQSISYLISIIFSAAVLFNAYNIMNNNSYISLKFDENQICSFLLLCLIFLLMFITFFANSYFLMSKLKEIAIIALNGVWSYRLLGILCFENLIIGVVGILLGLILGIGIMPIILSVMYKLLGVSGNIWTFPMESIWSTVLIILFIICPYVIAGDYIYVSIKKEIKDLTDEQRQTYQPDTRVFQLPKVTFLIVYLIPLTILFINPKYLNSSLIAYFNIFISITGTQGVIRYYIPEKILKLKKKRYLNDKIKLISLSNLHYSMKKLNFLVAALSMSCVVFIYIIGLYKHSSQIKVMSIFVYISAVLSIGLGILYKVIIEISTRKHIFKQLKLVGYTSAQIKKTIMQEIVMFYGITVGVPLLHILIYLTRFIREGIITILLAEILLAIFIGIFAVIALVSYEVYKKQVLEN